MVSRVRNFGNDGFSNSVWIGIEVRSVGNSAVLKETCLIEAFNLKVTRLQDFKGACIIFICENTPSRLRLSMK